MSEKVNDFRAGNCFLNKYTGFLSMITEVDEISYHVFEIKCTKNAIISQRESRLDKTKFNESFPHLFYYKDIPDALNKIIEFDDLYGYSEELNKFLVLFRQLNGIS